MSNDLLIENIWSKEECRNFFQQTFSLELTDSELESIWLDLSSNILTPLSKHGGNNLAFSPMKLKEIITQTLARTAYDIKHPGFKKIREEVIPALVFALFLKGLGHRDRLIVISDVPDIALVDADHIASQQKRTRVGAIPIESIFYPESAGDPSISDSAERVAEFVKSRKFNKRYRAETVLLITLNASLENLDLRKLSALLVPNTFHNIWLLAASGKRSIVALLTPELKPSAMDFDRDLLPLLY
ncbi:hypothetical protein A2853_01490 [Candidatus Kaiserbacteria bacterium RIFCSPHIGHO2_01_FULL_55_17]|uniref:Uncharacterized protein n=1 Tax=Candidatus Kaiserbacteria bacterium RIFCSPHIGHO2_01_FULL_55_17 TaxID=1798484 RepID=A0A1F6D9Y8_9BACT|nr:MAG: hypothetical protein A2853_01490 [Candidatus Kaiserbacteria bacterium RIFCSPHIGHO2_01_FULL_55_17]